MERSGLGKAVPERLHDGHDAARLLVLVYRLRTLAVGGATWARRLAAHVEDHRAFGQHRLGVRERGVEAGKAPAVGERVGRDVENAHHARAHVRERGRAQVEHAPVRQRQHEGVGGRHTISAKASLVHAAGQADVP